MVFSAWERWLGGVSPDILSHNKINACFSKAALRRVVCSHVGWLFTEVVLEENRTENFFGTHSTNLFLGF